MSNSCYRGGKRHKFEPRYDETEGNKNLKVENYSASPTEIRKLFILRKYVGEVCKWCGDTRPRKRI
jgi:hypothetical protein